MKSKVIFQKIYRACKASSASILIPFVLIVLCLSACSHGKGTSTVSNKKKERKPAHVSASHHSKKTAAFMHTK